MSLEFTIGGYFKQLREELDWSLKKMAREASVQGLKKVTDVSLMHIERNEVFDPGIKLCCSVMLATKKPVGRINLAAMGLDPNGPLDATIVHGYPIEKIEAAKIAAEKAFMEVLKGG